MNPWADFLDIVSDLLEKESVQKLWDIKHHVSLSCYEHSVFVAYMSYRTARKLGLDYVSAARAGLLHDLYLYDSDKESVIRHCLNHASSALENAKDLCDLNEKEENIILAHMWPLSRVMPKSREAFVVSMCDKYCATMEFMHVWHRMKIRRRMPAMSQI